jgi:hypothetical protein
MIYLTVMMSHIPIGGPNGILYTVSCKQGLNKFEYDDVWSGEKQVFHTGSHL